MYTVDYFIKKFEAIPESKIISFNQFDGHGNHCALGWCNLSNRTPTKADPEADALIGLFAAVPSPTNPGWEEYGWSVADINNGDNTEYQQPTPKQRILAALRDIKAMQEKEQKPERIKTVYVSVPETIKEQIKEPVLS